MAEDAVSANVQSALIDAGLWLYHGFFVPGDYVSSILSTHAPRVGQFLGLGAVSHGSVLSGIISGVVWLGAIALICATVFYDQPLTNNNQLLSYLRSFAPHSG